MSLYGALSGGISGAMIGTSYAGWGWGTAIGFVIGAVVGGFAAQAMTPDIPAYDSPLQELQVTTNEIGLPIPDVLGTAKITGNLLFYGGERSEEVTQETGGGGKGGGSSTTSITGYKYYMSWAIGICAGPVDEILTIFRNEDVVWSGNTVRPGSGGEETIIITDMGSVTFYFGTDDQAANAALGALMDDATLNTPYRGLCWAFFDDCYIGDYNRMPTMRFVLRKSPVLEFSVNNVIDVLDYNPAHAIWYILHDLTGLPEEWLDEDDFEEMAETLLGESRGISLLMDSQQSALNYLENINGHVDAIVRYGGDGKFHPKLIRDDYTVGDLPLIDENIVLDDPAFSRKSWIDTINDIKVQYSEISGGRGEQWYIDGVLFSGTIKTVGAGKDYASLSLALNANPTGPILLLVYPGTYMDTLDNTERPIYIKGRGTSYEDVILASFYPAVASSFFNMLIEWCTIAPQSLLFSPLLGWVFACNKCALMNNFGIGTGMEKDYGVKVWSAYTTPPPVPASMTFSYCKIDPRKSSSTPWVWDIYSEYSGFSLEGTITNHVWHLWDAWHKGYTYYDPGPPVRGNFAYDATLHSMTQQPGYGPEYGDYRITNAAPGGCNIKQSTADPAAVDIGNKEIQGRIVGKTIQTALFTTNDNAVWAGVNALWKESYPFAQVSFPANRNAFRLEVGDCFKFSYARYGVSNMICRVLQISEDGPESETITVQAMEDIFSIANAITEYSTPTGHAVPPPGYTVLPFTHQKIIEAPYVISTIIKLLPIACRESYLDLGYDVHMSIDGGSSYPFLMKITSLQPYGTLVGTYSDDTFTIDDDTGLTINIEHGASLIETTTWDQILAGLKNTALLGDEIISFQTITPVSGTQYKLENVIRGRYDTVKESHSEGAEFYCLPSGTLQLISSSEIVTGAVRKFKFVPYNIKKSGAIADCAALTLTIEGRALKPYTPANLQANGSGFAARYDDDIVLTWSPRYRGKGAGIGLPGTVLADADREGLFKVEVYVASVLVRTTDEIDAATWTYTEAMNIADNGSPAASVTFKVSDYRTENGNTYESEQAEVTCKLN